jgi:hypothetical protein
MLSKIQVNQNDAMRYGVIRELKVKKIVKKGNKIDITLNTLTSLNTGLSRGTMTITFENGLSQDATVNNLFRDFSHYVKMRE